MLNDSFEKYSVALPYKEGDDTKTGLAAVIIWGQWLLCWHLSWLGLPLEGLFKSPQESDMMYYKSWHRYTCIHTECNCSLYSPIFLYGTFFMHRRTLYIRRCFTWSDQVTRAPVLPAVVVGGAVYFVLVSGCKWSSKRTSYQLELDKPK